MTKRRTKKDSASNAKSIACGNQLELFPAPTVAPTYTLEDKDQDVEEILPYKKGDRIFYPSKGWVGTVVWCAGGLVCADYYQGTRLTFPCQLVERLSASNDIVAACGNWKRCLVYPSKGKHYYRFTWGKGHEIQGEIHIPGGNDLARLARERARKVDEAIAAGKSVEEIVQMIDGWKKNSALKKAFK